MNETTERLLADWLAEGPDRGPVPGLERALAATRRTSQRPGWTIPERWNPMQLTMRPAIAPPRLLLLVAVGLLAIALAATVAFVASQRHTAPAPPFGPAANGSIVLDVGNHLWQVPANGGKPSQLDIGLGEAVSPLFSPDGTKIAFMTHPAGKTGFSLYVANADGTGARSISGSTPIASRNLAGMTWAPNGSSLVYASGYGLDRLYRVGADGSDLRPISGMDAQRNYPAFSPDGAWLAYQHVSFGHDNDLAISRPDGTGERILLAHGGTNGAFGGTSWVDEQHLVYFRMDRTLGHEVVGVVDLDGHETLLSKPSEEAWAPAVSPDGRRVAFALQPGTAIVDIDDPSHRIDLPPGLAEGGVGWSPDASFLLGLGADYSSLYRIPVDNPGAATKLDLPAEVINGVAWQRIAP